MKRIAITVSSLVLAVLFVCPVFPQGCSVKGCLVREPAVNPLFRPIHFNSVKRGEQAKCFQYCFVMPGNYDFAVTNVAPGTPFIRVVRTSKKSSWECHTFDITFKARLDEPLGNYSNKVTFFYRNGSGPIKSVTVPVSAKIESEISVFPDTLFFGIIKPIQTVFKSVVLESTGKPINITEISNPAPGNLDLYVEQINGETRLVARLHNLPSGCYKWLVTLTTDNKDRPCLEIPVYAYSESTSTVNR